MGKNSKKTQLFTYSTAWGLNVNVIFISSENQLRKAIPCQTFPPLRIEIDNGKAPWVLVKNFHLKGHHELLWQGEVGLCQIVGFVLSPGPGSCLEALFG